MGNKPPRLVVLDRDGVINYDSPDYIKSVDEWHPIPGSLDAIANLCRAGYPVWVATNQSGVGRGLLSQHELDEIHRKMLRCVQDAGGDLAGILVCPHRPEDSCTCRKPKPGLLQQIEAAASQRLLGQPVIGDSERDIEAALQIGARPILVRTGNGKRTEKALDDIKRIDVFDDLATAVTALVNEVA